MNDLENYIMSKEDKGISADELKSMGRRAASAYIETQKPLNNSIQEIAKEASLNHEQVKRVVEFANNDTFIHIFKGGFNKNITFPMADSSAVMQGTNETIIKTASTELRSSDYIAGQEGVSLEKAFGWSGGLEKTASVDSTSKTKLAYLSAKNRLDELESNKEVLVTAFSLGMNKLAGFCKQASSEGYTNQAIGSAIHKAQPSDGLLLVINEATNGVAEEDYLDKLAMGGFMIPQNPITGLTQQLEGVAQKLVAAQSAVVKTQASMNELLAILKGPEMMPNPGSDLFGMPPQQAMPPQQPPEMQQQVDPQTQYPQEAPPQAPVR